MTLNLLGNLHAHDVHEKLYLKGDIQEGCKGYNKYGQRETLEVRSIKTTITTNINDIKQIRCVNDTIRNHFITNANIRTNDVSLHC